MTLDKKANTKRNAKFLRWLWLPGIAAALYYYLWIQNPLPSDEEMIENFQARRVDFVEAVRRYRDYPRPPDKDTSRWYLDGDTLEVYKRAGIDGIRHSAWTPWLPNPYSVETAMNMKSEHKAAGPFGLFYKHGALNIRPATTPRIDHPDRMDNSRYRRNTLIFGVIWKEYVFFPEVPRIKDGVLLGPLSIVTGKFPGAELLGYQFHEKEGVATTQYRIRVLPSLNRLPSHWKGFECVLRQIEPQWFLQMCNGRH